MKKVCFVISFILIISIIIPILIIGGIGPGIKLPLLNNKKTVLVKNTNNLTDFSKAQFINVFVKNKIVRMNLEDYIVGVVGAEMPVSFNIEALKAQAVTARTYAVAKMIALGGNGCVKHKGADVCSDIHCQAYISKEARLKSWKASEATKNWEKLCSVVKATEGQIVCYKNRIASGVKYFSTSNGKTEDSVNVFGYREPYLVSVVSANEDESPGFKSNFEVSRENFENRLKQITKNFRQSLIIKINSVNRSDGGRVNKVKINGSEFSGQQIRQAFNLKSTDFNITVSKDTVKFSVRGYGHGVGLSQWGANEMGKRGKDYVSIIQHYFTGTNVQKMEDVLKK